MFDRTGEALTKLLPREHGATVIWLSSSIVALLSLHRPPEPARLLLFMAVSTAFLEAAALITRSSRTVLRAKGDPVLLPLMSSSLTLVAPLGTYLMDDHLPVGAAATWLLLLTYTWVSVLLARRTVRNAVLDEHKALTPMVLGGALLLGFESLSFSFLGWIHPAAVLSVLPLLVAWLLAGRADSALSPREENKRGRIRRIGLLQTGSMLAFASITPILAGL